MAKKIASPPRRFEILEDRRLLTTWNVSQKFNNNGSGAGGEAAFGDSATETAAQLQSTYNNNYDTGNRSASDAATVSSPWSFGDLDSGQVSFDNAKPYSFSSYVDPNSFNNYLSGAASPPWSPGYLGTAVDDLYPGVAGFFGGATGTNAVVYNYGNNGLNGNGSGAVVPDTVDNFGDIPTGTLVLSPAYGPTVAQFTAPESGYYRFAISLTNPYFDPFNGPTGGNGLNDAWSWDAGQADFLVYDVPAGSSDANNTSTLLDSGFYEDIQSINQADIPAVGDSISSTGANPGIVVNTGTATGASLNSTDLHGQSFPDTGLPVATAGANQATTTYSYGSGGTWSLKNVGAFPNSPSQDTTGDEYDMSWTVTQTFHLTAGDQLAIVDNPRYMQGQSTGDAIVPIYLSASIQPTEPQDHIVVTTSGATGTTYSIGGSAVAVDAGVAVSTTIPGDDVSSASMTIANFQPGDSLNYTTVDGIAGSYNSGSGVLTLSGSATPSQYAAALQSVTFSTTNIPPGGIPTAETRTIDVVAYDTNAIPHTSNTGVDTVNVAIDAPVVTAHQTSISSTAGQTVTVDSAVTVSSFDTDVTGATMSIGTGFQSSADTLHFSTQNGITGSYNSSSGVLTLSGSATPGNYQTALASVTFSSTSTSTATRNISMVVADSGDTGNVASNTATTQILVSAPITITQAYVKGSAWQSAFLTYLGNNSLGSSTFGYALKTGAAQTTDLPFNNINTIVLSFSGAVSDIGQGSLKLVGGTGPGAAVAPSITGFTSLGSNTYSWTLSGSLGNNKYVMALATTGSSFGTAGTTQVVDAHGAGISGHFVTNTSTFPSGNGLANSTFDFFFNVLPGDANQNAAVATSDTALVRPQVNKRSTQAGYSPYYDYNGAGVIGTTDIAIDGADTNTRQSTITSPAAPAAAPVGGSGFTALALGVQESGSSSSGQSSSNASSAAVLNFGSTSLTAGSSSSADSRSSSSPNSGSAGGSTSTTSAGSQAHGRHRFAATDEAVGEFDLADLWV